MRRPSKDDSVLKDFSVPYSKTSKTQDAFNRFLRRGSLEGGTMFLKRKQAALKSLSSGSTDFHVFHGRGKLPSLKSVCDVCYFKDR